MTEEKQTGKNFYLIDDADKYGDSPAGPYKRTDARRLQMHNQRVISRAQLAAMRQQRPTPPQGDQTSPYRMIALDVALQEVSHATPDDPHAEKLIEMKALDLNGQRRTYYTGAGAHRTLIVLRNGISLEQLQQAQATGAAFAKILLGWDRGEIGYVRKENEGKQHTKITIDLVFIVAPDIAANMARQTDKPLGSLAEILSNAPRADKRGGSRNGAGRPAIPQGENVTIALEGWQARKFEEIGSGNIAAGIRLVADRMWPEEAAQHAQ